MTAVGRQSFLVVFDFDHTLIDCNSDEEVPTALGRGALLRQLIAQRMQWTRLMDTLLAPYTRDAIARAVRACVRVDADMPAVLQYLHSLQRRDDVSEAQRAHNNDNNSSEDNGGRADVLPGIVEVDIVSDANAWFIDAALDSCLGVDARATVTQIHTNPCYDVTHNNNNNNYDNNSDSDSITACAVDEAARDAAYNNNNNNATASSPRRMRVGWYEPHGHTCDFCNAHAKPNMCKSRVLHRILATTNLLDPTIIYVGDGLNDYCPVLNVLRPRDVVLARRDMRLHAVLAGTLSSSTPATVTGGCCAVGLWRNAAELLSLLRRLLDTPSSSLSSSSSLSLTVPRLPTLVRFRDAGADEFRAVTLHRRIPAVLQRTLAEHGVTCAAAATANADGDNSGSTNASTSTSCSVSACAVRRVRALLDSCACNTCVPTLPGQCGVPAWLRGYAYTSEFDRIARRDGDARSCATVVDATHAHRAVAPRWGQLPWLQGEIYFYHLLWQYMMLADDAHATKAKHNDDNDDDEDAELCARDVADGVVNLVTPYVVSHPLHTQTCTLTTATHDTNSGGGGASFQQFVPDFLAREPLACAAGITIQLRERPPHDASSQQQQQQQQHEHDKDAHDATASVRRVSYAALASAPGDGLVSPRTFVPYRDIFAREKHHLLHGFVHTRVLPMLACEPWCADVGFAGVLLRWMLWANALDLSMFTLDQLSAAHGSSSSSGSGGGGDDGSCDTPSHGDDKDTAQQRLLRALRADEQARTLQQDGHLVGNDVDAVAAYLAQLIARTHDDHDDDNVSTTTRNINIVMDNVGVECVADLCFGLWYLHHTNSNHHSDDDDRNDKTNSSDTTTMRPRRARVTYHVKPMPYYVSDVTPADLTTLLDSLEAMYKCNDDSSNNDNDNDDNGDNKHKKTTGEERAMYERVLRPFVARVRDAFASGAFCVDADLTWTQPCEYRELPPRVVNRFFYTQRVTPPLATPSSSSHAIADTSTTTASAATTATTAAQFYRANKQTIVPRSALVLFKGDLNYRRLIGDRHWNRSDFLTTLTPHSSYDDDNDDGDDDVNDNNNDGDTTTTTTAALAVRALLHDTPRDAALDGASFADVVSAFWPTHVVPVCSIRTIKSECCVGVPGRVKAALDATVGKQWRISGKYGEVLFASS